jgi:MazG family protein
LGDLLLQVVFHGRMAEEQGLFDFDQIAAGSADKMVRRHPHVFGDAAAIGSSAEQVAAWEATKAAERLESAGARTSALDGVALALPALTRAVKIQRRAARVGFDWPAAGPILDKIEEEIGELRHEIDEAAPAARIKDELGDLLFAVTNLARRLDCDPEATLAAATAKFERRFRRMEALSDLDGLSADQMEALWDRVKTEEKQIDIERSFDR